MNAFWGLRTSPSQSASVAVLCNTRASACRHPCPGCMKFVFSSTVTTLACVTERLLAAASSLSVTHANVVTVELKTNFMQPGQGCLHALARVLHKTATLAYCEGEVRNPQKALIAKALGTFKYVRKRRAEH